MGTDGRRGRGRPGPDRIGRGLAALLLAALVVVVGVGAVRSAGAWAIVRAPNHDRIARPAATPPADVTHVVRAEVGPPVALLEAWVLDPDGPPRGTTLVLHGIRDDKRAMLGVGRALRDRGQRAVLVDLRGHGGSSGSWLTYGVVESRDLAQLLDLLEGLDLLDGPVGVYGPSYGGAVGLQLAARDPRVRAVASLSTFASLRQVVPPQARITLPGGLGALLPDLLLDTVVDDAGDLGGFSPDAADTRTAIARTHARVLLVHGRRDRAVPFGHAEALLDACPIGRCALLPLETTHAGALASPDARAAAIDFLSRAGRGPVVLPRR